MQITAVFDDEDEVVGIFSTSNKACAYITVNHFENYGYESFDVDQLWSDEIHRQFNEMVCEVIKLAKDLSNE